MSKTVELGICAEKECHRPTYRDYYVCEQHYVEITEDKHGIDEPQEARRADGSY